MNFGGGSDYKMRKNLHNSIILLFVGVLITLGCKGCTVVGRNDPEALQVERGRFKVIRTRVESHSEFFPYRKIEQKIYFDGKEWIPDIPDKNYADGIEEKFGDRASCSTSPNPNVEVLLCGDHEDRTTSTYVLRIKNDQPEAQFISSGLSYVWIDDDGRWLLNKQFYYNIETDEKIAVKGISYAEDETAEYDRDDGLSHYLFEYVVAVSPDKKTIIGMLDHKPIKKGAEEFLTLDVIDAETGNVKKQTINFTKNRWLKVEEKDAVSDLPPPSETSKHFVWKKDANGKDQPIF